MRLKKDDLVEAFNLIGLCVPMVNRIHGQVYFTIEDNPNALTLKSDDGDGLRAFQFIPYDSANEDTDYRFLVDSRDLKSVADYAKQRESEFIHLEIDSDKQRAIFSDPSSSYEITIGHRYSFAGKNFKIKVPSYEGRYIELEGIDLQDFMNGCNLAGTMLRNPAKDASLGLSNVAFIYGDKIVSTNNKAITFTQLKKCEAWERPIALTNSDFSKLTKALRNEKKVKICEAGMALFMRGNRGGLYIDGVRLDRLTGFELLENDVKTIPSLSVLTEGKVNIKAFKDSIKRMAKIEVNDHKKGHYAYSVLRTKEDNLYLSIEGKETTYKEALPIRGSGVELSVTLSASAFNSALGKAKDFTLLVNNEGIVISIKTGDTTSYILAYGK